MNQIVLLAGQIASPIALPLDFNPFNNLFECYGAGSNGSDYPGGAGGAGGAYSATPKLPFLAGKLVYFGIGAPGIIGGDTWCNGVSNAIPTSTSQGVLAKGGGFSVMTSAGGSGALGGQSSACIGTTKYSGGNGGRGYFHVTTTDVFTLGAGGGGGCAGPNGAGASGGNASTSAASCAGGGGSNGGSAGSTSGDGGHGHGGSGAGAAGGFPGAPGTGAGGGGGLPYSTTVISNVGGIGSGQSLYGPGIGPGGGTGGGAPYLLASENAALGAGGGGVCGLSFARGSLGGYGFIVITYTPINRQLFGIGFLG